MIVISMILILVSISIPAYNQSILRAKESVLKQDLFQLRSLISQYTLDKQKAPQSLDDLVQAGYIKQIPTDPMTGSNSTWTVDQEDSVMSVDQQDPGISDVHSGASPDFKRRHRLQHLVVLRFLCLWSRATRPRLLTCPVIARDQTASDSSI